MHSPITALVFSWVLCSVQPQTPQQLVQNPCVSRTTCRECISTPTCAWCYDASFNTTKRCFQRALALPPLDQCPENRIYDPDNEIDLVGNLELSSRKSGGVGGGTLVSGYEGNYTASAGGSGTQTGGGFSGGDLEGGSGIIQIRPQRVALKLRAKQTYSIHMYYTQAEDYPVDLYYLMDLSKSMQDDKEKLSMLGDRLADTMKKMTSKFTLGFGSFVDKVVMPYVSTIPEKLVHPCTGCVAPYGFRNHMTLSTNTNKFSQMVKEASVSGNLDAPEGGFDAIMQAVVCDREIGWRDKARHLLVFSTDAGFHYAGDGKLGGIVKPNDGDCHLDQRGYYTMSSKQDYPSISQINTYVKKKAINVIFAVTSDKLAIYEQLKNHVEGSSCGKLSNDSSNVVELIQEQYEAISSTVELKHNASSAVKIKFFSKCLDSNGEMVETNKCGNIKVGSSVHFRVELEVIKCPRDPKDWKQTIRINPVGINESLTIDLTMLCDCPCERVGSPFYKENALECRKQGNFICGICQCIPPAYGPNCECSSTTTFNISTANCINKKYGLECSGRGSCVCGKCECEHRNNPDEIISGDTCECDNFSCPRHNDKICSGRGTCNCRVCDCEDGWTGDDCNCRNKTDGCVKPNTNDICSNNGECVCNECKCKGTGKDRYYGKFCEYCPVGKPNCTDDCKNYKDCVQCHMYKTGNKTEKECQACPFTPLEVEVVEVNEKNSEILCAFYDEDDCRFSFVYYYDDNKNLTVRAQKERECPPEVYLLGFILGIIAAVVLLGLATLLLWKLCTTIHDRREFARFEKEAMMARWDTGENPIYKQATSTFKNPTYAGKS